MNLVRLCSGLLISCKVCASSREAWGKGFGGPIFLDMFFVVVVFVFSVFFLGKQNVSYILDGFRAISLGFPKKTFIPFFCLKRTKRKEGRKEGRL